MKLIFKKGHRFKMKRLLFTTIMTFLAGSLCAKNSVNLTKILTIWGDSNKPYFGSKISNIGDINNDGYEDLAICDTRSPETLGTSRISQRAYIYFGGAEFDTIPDITFRKSLGGINLYGKMDLNGDGFTDMVLSDPIWNLETGRIWIFLGAATGFDTIPDFTIKGEDCYHNFGQEIKNGDLNNDGYDDLIVSAPHDIYAAFGRIYIFLGSETFDTTPDWYYQSNELWANYGEDIECGDLNSDGYDDFFILAPYNLSNERKIYIYSGGDSLSTEPVYTFVDSLKLYDNLFFIENYNSSGKPALLCQYMMDTTRNNIVFQSDQQFEKFSISNYTHSFYQHEQNFNDYFQVKLNNYGNNYLYPFPNLSPDGQEIFIFIEPTSLQNPDTCIRLEISDSNTYKSVRCVIDLNGDGTDELIIRAQNSNSSVEIYSFGTLTVAGLEIDKSEDLIIENYRLLDVYPNPFNLSTVVPFEVSIPENIKITVYDLSGREVEVLTDQLYNPGKYSVRWNGKKCSSGLYIIQMKGEKKQSVKKTVLLK